MNFVKVSSFKENIGWRPCLINVDMICTITPCKIKEPKAAYSVTVANQGAYAYVSAADAKVIFDKIGISL